MNSERKRLSQLDLYRVFLGCVVLESALALWFLSRVPTETQIVVLSNFSVPRLVMGLAILLVLGSCIFLLYDSLRSQNFLKNLIFRLETAPRIDIFDVILKTSLIIIILICSAAFILFYSVPYLQRLLFFIPDTSTFTVLGERIGFFIAWIFLLCLQILIFFSFSGKKINRRLSLPARLMVISWTVVLCFLGLFVLWSLVSATFLPDPFIEPGIKLLVISIWFSFWAFLDRREKWADRLFTPFVCISIGLVYLLASTQIAQYMDNWGPRPKDHFILLAYSFLHGKLYLLPDLLKGTGDLILHNQQWYVAFPPFPVILLVPLVAIWGIKAVNFTAFSLVLASLAVVVIFLVLDQLIRLSWVKLSRSGAVWLTALFAFGTVYWWLAIHVADGFLCQVVTVLACGLAFLAALRKYSPWLTGAFLAMAILCRPNVFVLWPALLAITIQLHLNKEKLDWRYAIQWGMKSAIPICLGVGLLTYYNYVRFGNFFDFGYAAINGSAPLMEKVQQYGVWNIHYASFNLRSMFVSLPKLTAQCRYYLPRGYGMSILMTTPALIYVVRKFKITWWMGGCWFSILLSIGLLAMYSNNGANQYGYRYVMDFIVPVIMLIAYNAGGKVSGLLKALILASVIINYYGIISWFKSPC